MAQQIAPVPQFEFGGVITDGHPLKRPSSSAAKCDNIRIMPGNWIRLRGGRELQYRNLSDVNGRFRRFYEVRLANGQGTVWHFAQYDNGSGKSYWDQTMAVPGAYNISHMEEINRSYGFTEPDMAPICTVRDRVFLGNGLGCRATVQLQPAGPAHASYPALTQYDGTYVRFVGLDNYCPGVHPSLTATEGVSGESSILYSRRVYVGLWNSFTGHFGNGVFVGEVSSASPGDAAWVGDVSVTGINGLVSAIHPFGYTSPSNEVSELKYVFWVTGDGGRVPYLVIDANGAPVSVDYGGGSKVLKLNDQLLLDVTQEMPTENFPPRSMTSMCYANGRVYGALAFNPSSASVYAVGSKEICAVVWSAAADDVQDRDFVGVPEESWPRSNRKYTPNGERPLHVSAAQDGTQVLILTHSGTFLLEETADGLHIWNTVSDISGIWDARSFVKTQYGFVWLDQRKQIVLLAPGSNRLQVLSGGYQGLLASVAPQAPADYLLDPTAKIDRYQIWIGGGKSVIHDFGIGGQAYTASGQDYTTACSMLGIDGSVHHIVAREHVWTHEASPVTAAAPTADQNGDGTWSEINGEWVGQWNDFGDATVRKEFKEWVVIADADLSPQLSANPLVLSWYGDLQSTESVLQLAKVAQDDAAHCYRAKVTNGNKRWLKFRVRLNGHHSDSGVTYAQNEAAGDLAPNAYGCVWESRTTINGSGMNR